MYVYTDIHRYIVCVCVCAHAHMSVCVRVCERERGL